MRRLPAAAAASCCLCLGCGAAPASTSTVPPEAGFAVARSAATPDDALPAAVRAALDESTEHSFGAADLRAARRVLAQPAGWLLPAAGGQLCLVQLVPPLVASERGITLPPAVSLGCVPAAAAREGRLLQAHTLSTGSASRRYRVAGVVPDGVRDVRIRSGRRWLTVASVRNAYEALVADPSAVELVTRLELPGGTGEAHG